MAKKDNIVYKLVNPETGTYYIVRRNPKKLKEKISKMKFDKAIRKTVLFVESKKESH